MLLKDRKFWENVSEDMERRTQFEEKLRELLGKRVEFFYSDPEQLKETEKEIALYSEVVGAMMALKNAIDTALKNDSKKIGVCLIMEEEWPEEIWQKMHTYFDCRGVDYEYKRDKELLLFRNEECDALVGDDFDMNEYGDPIIEETGELPCTNCVECPGKDNCTLR